MKVYTYFSEVRMLHDPDLLELWKASWARHGWEPEILEEPAAVRADPAMCERLRHSPLLRSHPANPPEYVLACLLGYVPMTVISEPALKTDIDVICNGYRPEHVPSRPFPLTFLSYGRSLGALYGNAAAWRMIEAILEGIPSAAGFDPAALLKDNCDQYALSTVMPPEWANGDPAVPCKVVSQPGWREAPMIVSKQYVQPQAATSLDRVSGMMAAVPISKGEQITLNKFISAKEAASSGSSLAMVTPIGKRAVTISIDSISAVGGMIRPGDYVDVVAMITVPVTTTQGKQTTQVASVPLFQNVLVLAIGQDISTSGQQSAAESRYKKEEKRVESPAITLALNPREASLLGFVQDQGKIRLALRSPSDAKIEQMSPTSWDSLFQYLMPPETAETKAKQAKEQAGKPKVPEPE